MADVTQILNAIEEGDPQAAEKLLPLVYEELRKLARNKMAQEPPDHTLQATALVHEAYIRLVGSNGGNNWDNRSHFFAAAAESMRRILVESARKKKRVKHGGELQQVEFSNLEAIQPEMQIDFLALDEGLTNLEQHDPKVAELVKLKVFAGIALEDIATILEISVRTAYRNWAYARAWLFQHLEEI